MCEHTAKRLLNRLPLRCEMRILIAGRFEKYIFENNPREASSFAEIDCALNYVCTRIYLSLGISEFMFDPDVFIGQTLP